ncbi:MAG: hypothetical protein ACRD04_03240 [Terriglobales bacterium]
MKTTLGAITFAMVLLAATFGLSYFTTARVQAAAPNAVVQTASKTMNLKANTLATNQVIAEIGNAGPQPTCDPGKKCANSNSFIAFGGNAGPQPTSNPKPSHTSLSL